MADLSAEQAARIRQRVQGWRAAEVRERELRRAEGAMTPADALEAALDLWTLMPENAEDSDPLREREVEQARAAWRRLRDGWR